MAATAQQQRTTLAVLAGGMGSRMGTAKGTLQIHGEPILAFLLDRLRWPGPTLLVTAPGRTSPPGAGVFDREAVDPVQGQGPLRGILTALENALSDVLIVTVDMPLIVPTMVAGLVDRLNTKADVDGLMYQTTTGESRVEPFPSIFRASARDAIGKAISESRRSVRGLLHDPRFGTVEASHDWPQYVWTNLNTPEEFAVFEKSFGNRDTM